VTGPWIGGVQVRRTDRGQTPIADFLCGGCLHHRRVTGRDKVTDFVRSNPAAAHTCPPRQQTT
jgi:hypothetical protein